jgi:hypothetical protein
MPSITYTTKDSGATSGSPERQWRAADANEVKTVVNKKSDAGVTVRSIIGDHTLDATDLAYLNAGALLRLEGNGGELTIPLNATLAFLVGHKLLFKGFVLIVLADEDDMDIDYTNDSLECDENETHEIEKIATDGWSLDNGKKPQFRGAYDITTAGNIFPSSGLGSGAGGVIKAGDEWYASVGGTLNGEVTLAGVLIKALVNTPEQVAANWRVIG